MNMKFYLLAEFDTGMIPLCDVAKKYLNMSDALAKRKACTQSLPFPVSKGSDSQKAGWFVFVNDLADYLQAQREKGHQHWAKMNNLKP